MALLDRLRTNTPTQSRRNEAMSDSGGKNSRKGWRRQENQRMKELEEQKQS